MTQKHLPLLWWGGEWWSWWWWWHVVAHDRRWKHRRDHVHLWMDELFVNYLFYMLVGNECQHLRTRMIPIVMPLMRNYIFFASTFVICLIVTLIFSQPLVILFVCKRIFTCEDALAYILVYKFVLTHECFWMQIYLCYNWLFLWTTTIDKHHHNKDLQLHFFCDGMIMKL
jgi:hypothetical protein